MRFVRTLLFFAAISSFGATAQDNKLQQIKEKGAGAPVLKNLEADNKKLASSFKDLLVKEGYTPQAGNCQTTCSVSCTWINGVCQPTTTCSVTCGF